MSIERQLREAFKRNETSLECPPSLDNRIMAEYEQMVVATRRDSKMKKRMSLPKVAIIALIIVVLCGFAYGGKLLFSDSKGNFTFQLQSSEMVSLSPDLVEKARQSLKEVQDQLEPGETAVVYIPEVYSKINLPLAATNWVLISDMQQWREVLDEQGITELLPDSLLSEAYQFDAGAPNSPLNPTFGMDAMNLLEEMKKENAGDEIFWRLTDTSDSLVTTYTSIYRDGNGEAIYLIASVFDEEIVASKGLTPPNTEYELIDFNGKTGHYTKYEQSLVGESNVLHNVMWIEENDGRAVSYNVTSDSITMTKERLLDVVRSLP